MAAAGLLVLVTGCTNGGVPTASSGSSGSPGATADPATQEQSASTATPSAKEPSGSEEPSGSLSLAPSTTAPAGTDACTLLTAPDLKQPGSPAVPKPETQEGWDSSCKWDSFQFNAGYKPPPEVDRGAYPPNSEGDLAAASESARRAAEVMNNSNWVIVRVLVRAAPPPRPQASSYTQSGRRYELIPPTPDSPDTCITATAWGAGAIMVVVSDATKVTPSCDTAKRLIALMAGRAPS